MNFTKHEQEVIQELEKRAGDVLYLKDVAPFFIAKSCLEISTYTHTAYIQVGEKMQEALSEYFQLVVFLKKLEENGACFSIPYTPLENNLIQLGNTDFQHFMQNTIADGDLLIQLFQFASKKYVMAPNFSEKFTVQTKKSPINLIIPSLILLLLFLFIGAIGYQSYVDNNNFKLQQQEIESRLEEQLLKIGLLSDQIQVEKEREKRNFKKLRKDITLINTSLQKQENTLGSIRYWNQRQSKQIKDLIDVVRLDSIGDF